MKPQNIQNNISSIIDLEFEISGEKLSELEWSDIYFLNKTQSEMAHAIHKIIMKNAWEIVSLEELRCQLIKNLHFIDLVKIKLDFSEKEDLTSCSCNWNANNNIEAISEILTNKLFAWIYYNEEDQLKTFSFILDISTGGIKYLKN